MIVLLAEAPQQLGVESVWLRCEKKYTMPKEKTIDACRKLVDWERTDDILNISMSL